MAHLTPVPDTVTDEQEVVSQEPTPAKTRRTGKILPTDRITFSRQLDILRGFAVAAADGGGSASSNTAGPLISMSHHTINIATPFFASVGLLNRADRGRFAPPAEVVEYSRASQWTPETAPHRLAPIIRKSWFGQIITRMVSVQPRDADEILTDLAGAAEVSTEHRPQLELLLEFTIACGLVQREGRLIRQAQPVGGTRVEEEPKDDPAHKPEVKRDVPPAGMVSMFRKDDTEGMVSFDVSVRVNMSDFAGWRPERISAFFGGIASVLAAKGRIEEDSGSGG